MDFEVVIGEVSRFTGQVIAINIFENENRLTPQVKQLDLALDGTISKLIEQGEIKGKFKEITQIFTMGKMVPAKVLVVGLGKNSELTPDRIRAAAAEIGKYLRARKGDTDIKLGYTLEVPGFEPSNLGQFICEGALLGFYSFKNHVSKSSEKEGSITFNIIISPGENIDSWKQGLKTGSVCAEAVILARNLVNEPANFMTPAILADVAKEQASRYDLDIQVLEKDFMQKEGMGGLLGVAQGSAQPPRFIVIKYTGKITQEIDIALVGKGITFDSGGISIKSSDGMGDMKGDMAGAAAVIAAITAIAQFKPAVNVVAIVPATENLPSGTAMRPGDVITQMNGKTVEIISTDAEGRLILADAICYAKKLGAKNIVDVATLTGACRIALGDVCSGIFSNDQDFMRKVISAGDKAGECLWPLPLKEEYRDLIKSDVADLKNSGGRYAGAITAAWFIAEFADSTPWVHLDIAGTFMLDKERGYLVKGATGIPVKTLINLVMALAT